MSAPRFHHQWLPDTVYVEAGGFHPSAIAQLRSLGHAVAERPRWSDLQVIWIEPSGLMAGASDPRGPGAPAGY
jgi:gamma-glutamyltranspeptidase/glutathione hydrolase